MNASSYDIHCGKVYNAKSITYCFIVNISTPAINEQKLPNKMKMCFLSISLFMKGANIISSRYDCTNQYEQWVMKKVILQCVK